MNEKVTLYIGTHNDTGLKYFGKTHSSETIKKMSLAKLGKTLSEEHKLKISKNSKSSLKETRDKMSKSHLGFRHSEESKKKMSEISMGKIISEDHKQKMRDGNAKRPIRICPHCSKEGKGGNMTRFHFDNCKNKKEN